MNMDKYKSDKSSFRLKKCHRYSSAYHNEFICSSFVFGVVHAHNGSLHRASGFACCHRKRCFPVTQLSTFTKLLDRALKQLRLCIDKYLSDSLPHLESDGGALKGSTVQVFVTCAQN